MRPAGVASGRSGRLPGIEDGDLIGTRRDGPRPTLPGDSPAATVLGAAAGVLLGVLAVSVMFGLHGPWPAVLALATAVALVAPNLWGAGQRHAAAAHAPSPAIAPDGGDGDGEPSGSGAETRVAHRLYGRDPGEEPTVRRRRRAA